MLKWLVNSGWWLENRHFRECRKPRCCHPGLRAGIASVKSSWRPAGSIGSIAVIFALVLLTACTDYVSQIEDRYGEWKPNWPAVSGTMTDSRDGQSYKTVTIGTQTWMAQNLNYKTTNSFCYEDNASNCTKYGRLYTWDAAMEACPSGWHLPDTTEWNMLVSVAGGWYEGGKLKSTNDWYHSEDNTDDFGFSVLPAGHWSKVGKYALRNNDAYFWSSTIATYSDEALDFHLSNSVGMEIEVYVKKETRNSVRCVKGKTTEKTSSSNKEKMSSSSKKVDSSSSITPKSSSSKKNVVSSSSSGAKGSSSSVSRSSSSSFIWKPSSSSSSESIFIPPSSSSVAVSPSLTDGGTCAPVYAIVESGEKVIWKYTVGGIVKTTDMLSANFKWTTPGGSPESLEGKGSKYMSDSVTYAMSGQHTATLILSTTKGSFNLTCEPVQVNPSSSSIAFPMSSSSSSITQKSSSSVALPVSSSSSVIPSSSSVSSPMSSWSGGGAGAIGSITDTRDGQTYKTVTIGSQIWMAQNLNYETENSYCNEDNPSNCSKYGRLYSWGAAMDSVGLWSANGKGCGNGVTCSPTYSVRGVCPTGWHLPNNSEWEQLFIAVGGSSTAGKMLRSSDGWSDGDNGMDAYSFAALPAGFRDDRGKYGLGGNLFIWSSSENGSYGAYYSYYDKEIAGLQYYGKSYAFSVRCVKD